MKNRAIILCIALLIGCINVGYADINYDAIVVLKDAGTSTPDGDNENPRTADDVMRMHSRLLEIQYHEKLLTANGTVTTTDTYIIGSSSTSILVSFPSASSCANGTTTKVFVVKNIGAGTMTLSPTIDGVGSPTVSTNQAMTIFTDGTRWMEVRAKNSASATRATDADNADLLNSQAGSYYRDASNLNAGEVPLAQLPATLTGKDADTLDGQHGAYYRDAANLNANTVPLAQIPSTLTGKDADTLDTINSTGFVWVNTTYLKSWQAGSVIGTGTMNLVAGAGIAITGTVTDGAGTVTITGVGTTTAGGFLDTGTQSVLTSGYQLNLNGGNIVGIADAHIPNTITLDNITQITTRNFSDLQGLLNIATQTSGVVTGWICGGVTGTGTLRIAATDGASASATYDGNGNGTVTVNVATTGTGNDQYTKLLLHGDQVGSLSTYLDSSEQEGTVTASGSVNGTTTQSVFGGSSFAFDGTGDLLTIADNPRLELGSNDFMIEARVRFSAFDRGYITMKEQTASTDFILFDYNNTNSNLSFQHKSAGSWVVNAASGSWTASLNTWYHLSCIRKGYRFRFYVDGVQKGSDVFDSDAIVDNTGAWAIGGSPSDSVSTNGYLDEIRMTIGTGRKPATSFTIPTTAYGSFTPQLSN